MIVTVDTNVIVRLLTQDDQLQYQQSLAIFQSQDIFIGNTVILAIRSGNPPLLIFN